jgi:hypothetical protein
MKIELRANKFSLYRKILTELEKLNFSNSIIRFPLVFYRLGCMFHLSRDETWLVLKELEHSGHIKIFPYKGIAIKRRILHAL